MKKLRKIGRIIKRHYAKARSTFENSSEHATQSNTPTNTADNAYQTDVGSQTDEKNTSDVSCQAQPSVSTTDTQTSTQKSNESEQPSERKYADLRNDLKTVDFGKIQLMKSEKITFVRLYESENPGVEVSISINSFFHASIKVHGKDLPKEHDFWLGLPCIFNNVTDIKKLMNKVSSYSTCVGNPDVQFQDLIPCCSGISLHGSQISAYRERDFGAVTENLRYSSTIRSVKCELFVRGGRCGCCKRYRNTLRKMVSREKSQEELPVHDFISSKKPNKSMNKDELLMKVGQLKSQATSLQDSLERIRRNLQQEIRGGICLDPVSSDDFSNILNGSKDVIEQSYPDCNSIQRLFWEEQMKYNKLRDKRQMRWHPMIIKWCIFIRSKSSAVYESMKDSGFISLPSSRTLFDYTHYYKNTVGFNANVTKQLKREIENKNLNESWQKFVGILQDEVKIKSDLVYDKHTGELVGYVNLDDFGNSLINLENSLKDEKSSLAKYLLVLMVRGIASDLRFPFAHFATEGITADLLYPILWKAVRILELDIGLKVMFITCDGASPNRRFFKLHSTDDSATYSTTNMYATDGPRPLFFISDVPHLIKTTRNCFSNSYSHKKTRKLWNNGKDISWLHIVDLYYNHCQGVYNVCPKLTKGHIDLTSFSYMKVNLAAQVLSNQVAQALEFTSGDVTSETVKFIKYMNKFFDILNSRSLQECHKTKNPDIKPFFDPNDERFEWLEQDFLGYFNSWRDSVENRNGIFSKSEKAKMQLSFQTLEGLEITVRAITECTRYVLGAGCKFVMTTVYNQDPLEQHFGHLRHKGGANDNPTVKQATNNINQIRLIGSQAIANVKGNTKRFQQDLVIDNTKLPKRPRTN